MRHIRFALVVIVFFCFGWIAVQEAPRLFAGSEPVDSAIASGSLETSRIKVRAGVPEGGYFYEAPVGKFLIHKVHYWFSERQYHAYVGASAKTKGVRPAVLLLHGSGRTGASMIDMWQVAADRFGVVLIAPDSASRENWSTWSDSAGLFDAIIEDAVTRYQIDRDQIYLFGHSAGGMYASLLAFEDTIPFRAIATHAGFADASDIAKKSPPKGFKPPIIHFLGTEDHIFSTESALAMGEAFADAGFLTKLVLMEQHTHWFYHLGPDIALRAMSFFAKQ